MANKYLRRLMRSGLLFFSSNTGAHQASATAAHKPIKGVSGSNWKSSYVQQGIRAVGTSYYSSCALRGSHCLPSYSATYKFSADEGDYISAHDNQEQKKEKLKEGKQQLVPSFKPLMHRASSHIDNRHSHSCMQPDFAAESSTVSKYYTRSWTTPSLHRRQHVIKLPHKARSFSSSGQSKDGSSRGKRAPKGHVAVYVEAGRERHVVPIAYLSHPHFQALLKRAESEFGFRQQGPGLHIPCSLSELHHTLHHIHTQ